MSDTPPPPPPPPPGFPPAGPPPGYTPYGAGMPMGAAPKNSGKAIASLVCGIVSLLCFGMILGLVAIGLSISAKKDIESSNGTLTGGGMATAGLVTGILGAVGWVLILALR